MSEAHPLFALFAILCGDYFLILALGVFAALADEAKGGDGRSLLCVRFFCFELLELLDLPDSLDSFSRPFPLETMRFLP